MKFNFRIPQENLDNVRKAAYDYNDVVNAAKKRSRRRRLVVNTAKRTLMVVGAVTIYNAVKTPDEKK